MAAGSGSTNYRRMARRAARRQGLDPGIFVRQIQAESGFDPNARSPAGARGIAQIMPETAAGWHVDPDDPQAALNAAARNMARYVRQFGSVEKALRAYNAGPGAVERSKAFGETNAYVAKILGGRSGKGGLSTPQGGGGGSSTTVTTTTPGVDNRRARAALVQSFLSDKDSDVLDFALQARALKDVPATSSTKTTYSGGGGGRGGGGPAKGSQIKELFYNGPGGANIKNGQAVPRGFVSGHTDHVHVAAGPKTVDRFGRMAERMGLHVGENPDFGGVDPVHVAGSYHYRDRAIDVSGDPELMRRFAKRVARYQRRRGR